MSRRGDKWRSRDERLRAIAHKKVPAITAGERSLILLALQHIEQRPANVVFAKTPEVKQTAARKLDELAQTVGAILERLEAMPERIRAIVAEELLRMRT